MYAQNVWIFYQSTIYLPCDDSNIMLFMFSYDIFIFNFFLRRVTLYGL